MCGGFGSCEHSRMFVLFHHGPRAIYCVLAWLVVRPVVVLRVVCCVRRATVRIVVDVKFPSERADEIRGGILAPFMFSGGRTSSFGYEDKKKRESD